MVSPHMGEQGCLIISRQAEVGSFTEAVDLRANFEDIFGLAAPNLIGITV